MISDRTGRKLNTITYDIILICQDIQRIHSLKRLETTLWHRERIVCKSDLLCFRIQLIHRKIIYITKSECILFYKIQSLTQLSSDLTGIETCLHLLIGNKEDSISYRQLSLLRQLILHIIRDEFVDRSLVASVIKNLKISETAHSDSLGILEKLLMLTLSQSLMDDDTSYGKTVEWFKCTSLEELRKIDDYKRITKVRFIRTVLKHRFFIADYRIRSLCNFIALRRKLLKYICKHLFANFEYILLSCKAHLKVQLIELTRRSVRSRILISEARSYLEILIKARNHEQLLILLRCLGKSIELALVFS